MKESLVNCAWAERGVKEQSEVNSKQEIPALLKRLEEEMKIITIKSVL